jgi:two-component system sensor histidine kinase TctE
MNRLLERVREGSLAQQAFLADAAHQLRTPLAALKTEAELALAAPHPDELHDSLLRLNAGAERAARLSSQLLALARADSAASAAMPSEALDWKDLAGDGAQDWVPRALAAGIDLGFELQSAPVQGRRFLLRELLANLLHNALAYAGRGAQVTVRSYSLAGQAVLEVEDNGPGIAPEERESVFQRFARGAAALPDAAGAAVEGSGLGLAIVRDIAHSHGGQVGIHTPAGGRGVLLRVTLPCAPNAP